MDEGQVILLPGEAVPSTLLPPTRKGVLTLGPGLRHVMPSEIISTTAGTLNKNDKKGATWLEFESGRYVPTLGDLVVAQIHHGATDQYYCMLAPHTSNAVLGHLAFEGANRKTRPQLKSGDVVYARVCRAVKGEDVEIECVNSATGKSDGLGPLKGGMIFNVSLAYARGLMAPGENDATAMLQALGEKISFEIAVGRNGLIWLNGADVKTTLSIGKALTDADQRKA
ncbi:hypothetical protein AMS68_004097 [Peltaster fructicola]|uniref:Ribosomal RNA-processing protein 40 n=1 Tax=Peltaster fructicola TaxID=286661 RepID=A0A6H0XVV4_9PEZI|nr:hypothetical protein AMS68_004097 [Peltaster fructicola]